MFSYLSCLWAENVRLPKFIPPGTTHILKLNCNINVREYNSLNHFTTTNYSKMYIPYTKTTDSVYTGDLCHFKTVTLGEFLHLIVPGESFQIDYLPIETYHSAMEYPEETELIRPKDYKCSCTHTTDDCIFHDFIIDKIYSKYSNYTVGGFC